MALVIITEPKPDAHENKREKKKPSVPHHEIKINRIEI